MSEPDERARIALISTGGTIEKTYDELGGVLSNRVSNLDVMLAHLELGGIELSRVALMNKDSLDMTPEDLDLVGGGGVLNPYRLMTRARHLGFLLFYPTYVCDLYLIALLSRQVALLILFLFPNICPVQSPTFEHCPFSY